MLNSEGSTKIADFGIAQMVGQTAEMGIFGTPSYMSPEQAEDREIGTQSDIFSLGCVLYELLTGEQAFPGNNNFSIMIIKAEFVSILVHKGKITRMISHLLRTILPVDNRFSLFFAPRNRTKKQVHKSDYCRYS